MGKGKTSTMESMHREGKEVTEQAVEFMEIPFQHPGMFCVCLPACLLFDANIWTAE